MLGLPGASRSRCPLIPGTSDITRDIRGRTGEERRDVRQERSKPIIDALEPWLRQKLALIGQKPKLAEAIRYAISRWPVIASLFETCRLNSIDPQGYLTGTITRIVTGHSNSGSAAD